jgi:hypothetical protein
LPVIVLRTGAGRSHLRVASAVRAAGKLHLSVGDSGKPEVRSQMPVIRWVARFWIPLIEKS